MIVLALFVRVILSIYLRVIANSHQLFEAYMSGFLAEKGRARRTEYGGAKTVQNYWNHINLDVITIPNGISNKYNQSSFNALLIYTFNSCAIYTSTTESSTFSINKYLPAID